MPQAIEFLLARPKIMPFLPLNSPIADVLLVVHCAATSLFAAG